MIDIDTAMSGPGSFEMRFEQQELRWAIEDEAYFRARQQAEALAGTRCGACGYTLGSRGHQLECGAS
jgi:hypothetical protein